MKHYFYNNNNNNNNNNNKSTGKMVGKIGTTQPARSDTEGTREKKY